MRKRLLSVLLALCMCIGLFPTAALAADDYLFTVNGEKILEAPDYTVKCGQGTAKYDPETYTLTLTDATLNTPNYNDYLGWRYSMIDTNLSKELTIVLKGDNVIGNSLSHSPSDRDAVNPILVSGGVKIEGTGTLTLYSEKEGAMITAQDGDLTIDGVKVTMYGAGDTGLHSGTGNVYIKNGAEIIANNCSAAITEQARGQNLYIENSNVTVSDLANYVGLTAGGDISITKSQVSLEVTGEANGIYVPNGALTVSESSLTAKEMEYQALWVSGNISITDSEVAASCGDSAIYSDTGDISVADSSSLTADAYYVSIYANNGDVEITGSTADLTSEADCAIYSKSGKVSVADGSDLTAAAKKPSIYANNGDVEITGSTADLTSTDNYAIYSASGKVSVADGSGLTAAAKYDSIYANGDVEITGSTADLTSTNYRAVYSKSGDISITGSGLTASSVTNTAIYSVNGNVNVRNSAVTADSPDNKYSIYGKAGGSISGSWIDSENSPLFLGRQLTEDLENIGNSVVFRGSSGTVKGDVSVPADATIDEGHTLTVPVGASLTVPRDVTLTNKGVINQNGFLTNNGEILVEATGELNVQAGGELENNGEIKVADNGVLQVAQGGSLTNGESGTVNVLPGSVSISGRARVGSTLTAEVSGLPGGVSASYKWQSGENAEGEFTNIDGAESEKYKLTGSERGKYIRVVVSDSKSAYTGMLIATTAETVSAASSTMSSVPSNPSTYAPTVTDSENGTATVSPSDPSSGQTVTITTNADEGYEVDEVTVTDRNGNPVAVTDNGDGTYSFTQPSGSVAITVTYAEDTPGGTAADGYPLSAFEDLDSSAWYHAYVEYAVEKGLMNGVSAAVFSPETPVTRAQVVTVLWRLENEPVVNYAMAFEDVAAEQWYTEAVRWAASLGIVGGYSEAEYGTEDAVTRQDMAAILYRYASYKGYDVSASDELSFTDAEDIKDYALTAMQWVCGAGIYEGNGDGAVNPLGSTRRCEYAALMMRFIEGVVTK